MADPLFDYNTIIQQKVPEGMFPGAFEGPSEVNQFMLDEIDNWWNSSPEEQAEMEEPSFEGVFMPGMERHLAGTLGEASYRHGEKPGWSAFVEAKKQEVARGYPEPKDKHAIGLFTVQAGTSGQERLLAERLDQGGQGPETAVPATPTAQPTPEPVDSEGLTRREIMEWLQAGRIDREEAARRLASLTAPTPTPTPQQ